MNFLGRASFQLLLLDVAYNRADTLNCEISEVFLMQASRAQIIGVVLIFTSIGELCFSTGGHTLEDMVSF